MLGPVLLRCVLACVFTVTFLRMQNEDRGVVGVGDGRLRVNDKQTQTSLATFFSPWSCYECMEPGKSAPAPG